MGWGIILLCFGVVLLLVNVGFMNWSVFRSFWVLWPLLFVVAGVSVLARHRRWVIIVAWVVFFAILIVYGYFYTQPQSDGFRWGVSPRTLTAEAGSGIDTAVFRLDVDAGSIDIAGGGDKLAVVDTNDRRLYLDTITSGGTETVEIKAKNIRFPFLELGGLRSSVALSSGMPWEIKVETDAANTEIDMADLDVTDLDFRGDACNLRLELSDNVPMSRISVRSDVTHITVVVPDDVGVRYTMEGDVHHVRKDNVRFIQNGSWFETEGYDTAEAQVEITIQTDVGFVTFTR